MQKLLLLAFAVVVAGGIHLPFRVSAQPAQPRSGEWRGTNASGQILVVAEDNTDLGRGPVLSGWLYDSAGVHRLHNPRFDYSDNVFRAEYLGRGQTNRVEVIYESGDKDRGTATGNWNGQRITFYEKR